jgi:hypothetical protein
MTATIDSDTSFIQLPSIHGVKHSGSLELGLHSTTTVNLHLMFWSLNIKKGHYSNKQNG